MTPAQRREITRYLEAFDFSGLFTDPSVGWDWPDGTAAHLNVPTKDKILKLDIVAEKRGVKVLHIPPNAVGQMPNSTERRLLEKAVRLVAAEHLLIFTDKAKTQQIWQWTQHTPGKPVSFREIVWKKGKANELLIQKLSSIAFTLDEEDALDITGVVQRLTDQLNRDTVTKRFYDNFKKQKDAFAKFIEGLGETDILAHYTSLMLNRIMFCYFLQRKGFLDGDSNYLRSRLASIQDEIGEDQFHSFYRTFLRRLFHEGLGGHPESRDAAFAKLIGNVPYLNGGIFDEHPIERAHPDINIPDSAFEKVFAFFDQYDWHLDERPIADGNEINPEILGYVFEKYTNQKEMGAYYTKEDITEYISKNCILPFLFNAVGKKLPASIWDLLKADPDRYIYEAVRRGAGDSVEAWEASLPENIRGGLHSDTLNEVVELDQPVQTLELRKDWNTPAAASHRLPTEIWRETIARHQRCHDLRAKLRAGEVQSIDDFITLNLDIRQFAQDVVETADAGLLLAFFKELKKVSVLDPTCGSGAFLFAALEILQPLYLACLERMRIVLSDWQSAGEQHPNWEKEIQGILDQAAAHPNEAYYINKTIIVHNLYGVDIMEEAIEICKLRLFLKLAAQLEPGQAVEPLPDIDFNVRAGNTLVGYASKKEIKQAVENDGSLTKQEDGLEQAMMIGVTSNTDQFQTIMEQAEDADRAFQRFHALQEDTKTKPADFRSAKRELNRILAALRIQLDRFLASDYDLKNVVSNKKFQAWQKSHQPFHWFIEFYGIMNSGGFDVIVGNPPYLEANKIKSKYKPCALSTMDCKNLYAYVVERCKALIGVCGHFGSIIPIGVVGVNETTSLRKHVLAEYESSWFSNYAIRPAKLFTGVEQRLTILVASVRSQSKKIFSTKYHQWLTAERIKLFECLQFVELNDKTSLDRHSRIPKIGTKTELSIYSKLFSSSGCLRPLLKKGSDGMLIFHRTPGYWIRIMDFEPFFESPTQTRSIHHIRELNVDNSSNAKLAASAISSNLYFWHFFSSGNCRNLTYDDVYDFPVNHFTKQQANKLAQQFLDLMVNFRHNSSISHRGDTKFEEFNWCLAKDIINRIDIILGSHFKMTEEEVDFIINYDIKIRMGLGS